MFQVLNQDVKKHRYSSRSVPDYLPCLIFQVLSQDVKKETPLQFKFRVKLSPLSNVSGAKSRCKERKMKHHYSSRSVPNYLPCLMFRVLSQDVKKETPLQFKFPVKLSPLSNVSGAKSRCKERKKKHRYSSRSMRNYLPCLMFQVLSQDVKKETLLQFKFPVKISPLSNVSGAKSRCKERNTVTAQVLC